MAKHKWLFPTPERVSDLPGIVGLITEGDITITRRGRLRAKILIFKDGESMLKSWYRSGIGSKHSTDTAAIHSDTRQVNRTTKKTRVDPRYFSIIAFSLDHLGSDTVLHEAVHSAFAYSRRTTKKWAGQEHSYEEAITYPTEGVYRGIQRIIYRAGLTTNDDYTR